MMTKVTSSFQNRKDTEPLDSLIGEIDECLMLDAKVPEYPELHDDDSSYSSYSSSEERDSPTPTPPASPFIVAKLAQAQAREQRGNQTEQPSTLTKPNPLSNVDGFILGDLLDSLGRPFCDFDLAAKLQLGLIVRDCIACKRGIVNPRRECTAQDGSIYSALLYFPHEIPALTTLAEKFLRENSLFGMHQGATPNEEASDLSSPEVSPNPVLDNTPVETATPPKKRKRKTTKKKKAAPQLQAALRGYAARLTTRRAKAVVVLQAVFRASSARLVALAIARKQAAHTIQANLFGYAARCAVQEAQKINGAQTVQAAVRGNMVRGVVTRARKQIAVPTIQAALRGCTARNAVQEVYDNAAERLQACITGYHDRQHVALLSAHARKRRSSKKSQASQKTQKSSNKKVSRADVNLCKKLERISSKTAARRRPGSLIEPAIILLGYLVCLGYFFIVCLEFKTSSDTTSLVMGTLALGLPVMAALYRYSPVGRKLLDLA